MFLDLGFPDYWGHRFCSPTMEMTDLGQGEWLYSIKQSLAR